VAHALWRVKVQTGVLSGRHAMGQEEQTRIQQKIAECDTQQSRPAACLGTGRCCHSMPVRTKHAGTCSMAAGPCRGAPA
jgi:hypothetical protein